MDTAAFLDHKTALSLLYPSIPSVFTPANERRPWSIRWSPAIKHFQTGGIFDQLWDACLMRTFDGYSGSIPDQNLRMLARESRMRQDNVETRKKALETHIDHAVWESTPYISFTTSHKDLTDLADFREQRRGPQTIIAVDPRRRFKMGLPILNYEKEMLYYGIQSRYGPQYLQNHYLCLWEVTPNEVVGIWNWATLRSQNDWYTAVIVPALCKYRGDGGLSRWNRESPDARVVIDDNSGTGSCSEGTQTGKVVETANEPSVMAKMLEGLSLDR